MFVGCSLYFCFTVVFYMFIIYVLGISIDFCPFILLLKLVIVVWLLFRGYKLCFMFVQGVITLCFYICLIPEILLIYFLLFLLFIAPGKHSICGYIFNVLLF